MRLAVLLIWFLCSQTLCSIAQQSSSDLALVLKLEKMWTNAYKQRDIGILGTLLAEDFIITVEDGSTYGKLGYIGHTADSSVRVDIAEVSELKVRLLGSVAVVTGAYQEKGVSKRSSYDYHDRFTDVWMKSASSWKLISSHYSIPFKPGQ